jgi:hypothetical protein
MLISNGGFVMASPPLLLYGINIQYVLRNPDATGHRSSPVMPGMIFVIEVRRKSPHYNAPIRWMVEDIFAVDKHIPDHDAFRIDYVHKWANAAPKHFLNEGGNIPGIRIPGIAAASTIAGLLTTHDLPVSQHPAQTNKTPIQYAKRAGVV